MKVVRIPAGIYAANCYLVYSEDTKEAIVIDPGGDEKDIITQIKDLELDIKYIIFTHGHGDHIAGVNGIKEYTNAPLAIHKDDEYLLMDGKSNFSSMMAMGTVEISADILLDDGDEISFGDLIAEIIHTPGHTPGGICIKIGDSIFTGDTLFAGSIGRTDFPKSSFKDIMNSINKRIIIYPDETKIYPGHGPATTIENEKRSNPFIK
ncbi:Beta-lactamase domain protein [[Clostridium] ultunense Esp]|uniref:Beta-lactamase domain protein n=1 Tax=[Clostridium] ultunense Esp TaxID=1288971 RepID=M1Z7N2_9FIRM|nr:MBL fold metallo-hydrolase [Schnuerera ultunensis]CCQ93583.1 Beta-lactamase domain protein [[Clostridium] ultunense Esp]SHD76903.1 Beta-lactamase domain protein [[Clostridium] ultunense Esp]